MTLAEQARRRIELARAMGCKPERWVATPEADLQLVAEAAPDAWSANGLLLYGIPLTRRAPISDWGLDLISKPGSLNG